MRTFYIVRRDITQIAVYIAAALQQDSSGAIERKIYVRRGGDNMMKRIPYIGEFVWRAKREVRRRRRLVREADSGRGCSVPVFRNEECLVGTRDVI